MTEGDITIRRAQAGDLPAVRALLAETWHDTYDALLGADWVSDVSGRWHAVENLQKQIDVPGTSFLVAVDQGRIVGHILADAREPPALVVARLYVLPAHQRGGVGGRLLAAAVAAHPDCGTLRLDVEARNEKGVAFYRREGFREVGRTVIEGSEHSGDGEAGDRPRMTAPHLEPTQEAGRALTMRAIKGGAFLIGPAGERWDRAMLVRQQSVEAFIAFASNEAYLAGMGHRTAALEDSRLLPLAEAALPA